MHAGDPVNGVHVHKEDRNYLWTLFLMIAVYLSFDRGFLIESRDCWLGQTSWPMSTRDPQVSISLVIMLLMHEAIAFFKMRSMVQTQLSACKACILLTEPPP